MQLKDKIEHFKFKTRSIHSAAEAEKYWTIRRESFNLLRQHVHGLRTAPLLMMLWFVRISTRIFTQNACNFRRIQTRVYHC